MKLELNDSIPVKFKLLTGNDETHINTSSGELRLMVQSGLGNYCLTLYKEGYEPLVRRFTIGSVSEDLKYLSSLILERSATWSSARSACRPPE